MRVSEDPPPPELTFLHYYKVRRTWTREVERFISDYVVRSAIWLTKFPAL